MSGAKIMLIDIVNLSTVLDEYETRDMVAACSAQLSGEFSDEWGATAAVSYAGNTPANVAASKAKGHACIVIYDDADQAGALGYHEESDGLPDGKVFAKTVMDYRGTKFGDPSFPNEPTISGTLAHEIMELAGNRDVNVYRDNTSGGTDAEEMCDAVEGVSYPKTVGNSKDGTARTVMVSDFVTRAYFDPQAKAGPFSFCGSVSKPFDLSIGGYRIRRPQGTVGSDTQDMGANYPTWKLAIKGHHLSRTARRLKASAAAAKRAA